MCSAPVLAPTAASSPSGKVWLVHVPRAAAVRGPFVPSWLQSALRCALARMAQLQRLGEPDAGSRSLTLLASREAPSFRGNRNLLSLVQRPGTSARIASTGRCGRLEDNQDATTLARPCKCKTNVYFPTLRFAKGGAKNVLPPTDELNGAKDVKNFGEIKRASLGRPQGNFHLDFVEPGKAHCGLPPEPSPLFEKCSVYRTHRSWSNS